MKILSAAQIKEADQFTIQHEPIASIDLMERAARACFSWIRQFILSSENRTPSFTIVAGTGNNGGDGLALARMLHDEKWPVQVFLIGNSEKGSPDFKANLSRLNAKQIQVERLDLSDAPDFEKADFIVDAIFGTGLNRPVAKEFKHLFEAISEAEAQVISIDLPSGLMADAPIEAEAIAVQADIVLTFQNPKLSLLLSEHAPFVGNMKVLDIGLHPDYINAVRTAYQYFTINGAARVRKRRMQFSHKGTYGHCLVIGGSNGMWGAPIMTAKACLRAGAGLVTVHTGGAGAQAVHANLPEVMVLSDAERHFVSELPELNKFSHVIIGPGLGQSPESVQVFKSLIQISPVPLVIDADALNILADNPTWLSFLPKGSILTPHPGEFARLVGKKPSHFEALHLQAERSRKFGVYMVLKGANTSVSLPDGSIWINSSGNPGMASAGMGDALTGIIGGLLASGYTAAEAAIFGVYLHGHAGDMALTEQSLESLLASDLINHLGKAFQSIGYAN